MKKLITLIIFVGLIAFLWVSCPKETAHQDAITGEDIASLITSQMELPEGSEELLADPEVQAMLSELGKGLKIDVTSYGVFSLGKISDQVVSFGIAGHVFTFKDKIVQDGAKLFNEAKEKLNEMKEE